MQPTRLLFIDDDEVFRGLLAGELGQRGYEVATAGTVAAAAEAIGREEFDLALVDLRLPDGDGLEVLRQLRARQPRAEVVVLTGHGAIDTAIEAMRLGAFDYLSKPCNLDALEVALQKALEHQALVERASILRDGLAPPDMGAEFVGASAQFRELCSLIDRVAPTGSSVLILGETGVGKEVVAKLIHSRSPRARQPFVVVECASLHEDLLHSELFGHEKGAYTGASQPKHGLFEVANGGTVFLDEIGDVSLATQVKLLRVIETGRFRHVGGTRELSVDLRFVAATNRDLAEMMERGFFRKDLFFRLNTIRIEVPPLRARAEDVPVLAEHVLGRLNARFGQRKRLSPAALDALARHRWPGNVRELLHVVESAVILSRGELIGVEDLPPEMRGAGQAAGEQPLLSLAEVERNHIARVLHAVGGARARAAEILGISERTLYRKLQEGE
jgi:DNA-binding NtrC family response regulator